MLRYDERRLLIGTRFGGLSLYDGVTLTPFPTEVDAFLKSASLYRGLALANGTIALASTTAGLAIIDRNGRRVAMLDQAHGLPHNAVYALMVDREGAIWTALERGLARVECPRRCRSSTSQTAFSVRSTRRFTAAGFIRRIKVA